MYAKIKILDFLVRLIFWNKIYQELESTISPEVESKMQELVQLVFQESPSGIDFNIKNTFLTVAKSYYYAAFCDSRTTNFHIAKVLFDKVI